MFKLNGSFELKDISTHRSELMGWAILWIMALHFTFTQIKPLGFIAQYGFAGVDIFMMVSGLGLYYSLDKDCHLARYYKKRFMRIFPTYYIIGIIPSLLLFNDDFSTYLFRYTTIGYWIGAPYEEWYVPAIVMLYLIAPIIKKAIDYRMFLLVILSTIVILSVVYYITDNAIIFNRGHFFLLYRIPAFVLGMTCAYWIKNKVTKKYFVWLVFVGIPFFTIFFPRHHDIYNYKYYSLLFLLPFFTIMLILFSKNAKNLSTVVSKIGNASLEIYLIQHIFFHAITNNIIHINSNWHDVITISLIFSCSFFGIITHWMINIFLKSLYNR